MTRGKISATPRCYPKTTITVLYHLTLSVRSRFRMLANLQLQDIAIRWSIAQRQGKQYRSLNQEQLAQARVLSHHTQPLANQSVLDRFRIIGHLKMRIPLTHSMSSILHIRTILRQPSLIARSLRLCTSLRKHPAG